MSAKGAQLKALVKCVKKYFLFLNNKNQIKLSVLKNYLKKDGSKEFIIFGFTSSIWFNLLREIKKKNKIKKIMEY